MVMIAFTKAPAYRYACYKEAFSEVFSIDECEAVFVVEYYDASFMTFDFVDKHEQWFA